MTYRYQNSTLLVPQKTGTDPATLTVDNAIGWDWMQILGSNSFLTFSIDGGPKLPVVHGWTMRLPIVQSLVLFNTNANAACYARVRFGAGIDPPVLGSIVDCVGNWAPTARKSLLAATVDKVRTANGSIACFIRSSCDVMIANQQTVGVGNGLLLKATDPPLLLVNTNDIYGYSPTGGDVYVSQGVAPG